MEEIENNIENELIAELKVPPGGFRGGFFWQSWRAATRNPIEALRYE